VLLDPISFVFLIAIVIYYPQARLRLLQIREEEASLSEYVPNAIVVTGFKSPHLEG
jgi:hypothetical protein